MKTHKIKTWQDAFKKLGLSTKTLPDVSRLPKKDKEATIARYKVEKIVEALNDGWEPNWDDSNENKYYPWFYMKGGFSFYSVYCYYSRTGVGSRLVFKNYELAEYAAKKFLPLYKKFMTK